ASADRRAEVGGGAGIHPPRPDADRVRLRAERAAEYRHQLFPRPARPLGATVRLHHRDPRGAGLPTDLPQRALLPGLAPARDGGGAGPPGGQLRPLRRLQQLLDRRAVGRPLQHGLSHRPPDAVRPRDEPDHERAERGDPRATLGPHSGRLPDRPGLHPDHLPIGPAHLPPDIRHPRVRRAARRAGDRPLPASARWRGAGAGGRAAPHRPAARVSLLLLSQPARWRAAAGLLLLRALCPRQRLPTLGGADFGAADRRHLRLDPLRLLYRSEDRSVWRAQAAGDRQCRLRPRAGRLCLHDQCCGRLRLLHPLHLHHPPVADRQRHLPAKDRRAVGPRAELCDGDDDAARGGDRRAGHDGVHPQLRRLPDPVHDRLRLRHPHLLRHAQARSRRAAGRGEPRRRGGCGDGDSPDNPGGRAPAPDRGEWRSGRL
ncbi:MAG: Uncharacterized MFS-type transporter, partial [uncultured Thermomicrobiales bacterium]